MNLYAMWVLSSLNQPFTYICHSKYTIFIPFYSIKIKNKLQFMQLSAMNLPKSMWCFSVMKSFLHNESDSATWVKGKIVLPFRGVASVDLWMTFRVSCKTLLRIDSCHIYKTQQKIQFSQLLPNGKRRENFYGVGSHASLPRFVVSRVSELEHLLRRLINVII